MTALQAVTRRDFLLTAWPWRSLGYLVTTGPVSLLAMMVFGTVALPWVIAADRVKTDGLDQPGGEFAVLVVSGVVLLATVAPAAALLLAALERQRLRVVDDHPVPAPRPPARPGLGAWLRLRYAAGATWRAVVYGFALATIVPLLYGVALLGVLADVALISSPFVVGDGVGPVTLGFTEVDTVGEALPYLVIGLVLVPAIPYLFATVAGAHAALARVLLDGSDGLAEVVSSRARLVDAFAAERRRIERDLHDGAQQRLVSLTLQLGVAKLDLPDGSPAAQSVAVAHDQAKQLMADLRELIRGIHPQVLTDVGLGAALRELADRAPIPVAVSVDLPARPAEPVESTAYFVVAEALTNVVKHSGARSAQVVVRLIGRTLFVDVADDGQGGADPTLGTGLAGLADRLAVVDGTMRLSSPAGGPTLVRASLPWR